MDKKAHDFVVTSVAISDYGQDRLLVSGSGDGTVRVYRVPLKIPGSSPFVKMLMVLFLFLLFLFALFLAGVIGKDEL